LVSLCFCLTSIVSVDFHKYPLCSLCTLFSVSFSVSLLLSLLPFRILQPSVFLFVVVFSSSSQFIFVPPFSFFNLISAVFASSLVSSLSCVFQFSQLSALSFRVCSVYSTVLLSLSLSQFRPINLISPVLSHFVSVLIACSVFTMSSQLIPSASVFSFRRLSVSPSFHPSIFQLVSVLFCSH
jgi:hypothetical protein